MKRAVILLAVAVGSGCASGGRYYQLPLTPSEAPMLFPALASTAQDLGLEMSQSADRVNVTLEDGTRLVWVNQRPAFQLLINLNESRVAAGQHDAKYREAKVRADQIWQLAIEARQKNSVGVAVLVSPPIGESNDNPGVRPTPQRAATSYRAPGAAAGSRPSSSCRSSLDCGSGQFCRDHGATRVCMGNGGRGDPCASGIDCGNGFFCRFGACAD